MYVDRWLLRLKGDDKNVNRYRKAVSTTLNRTVKLFNNLGKLFMALQYSDNLNNKILSVSCITVIVSC